MTRIHGFAPTLGGFHGYTSLPGETVWFVTVQTHTWINLEDYMERKTIKRTMLFPHDWEMGP